jgi:hypothetical protein
VHSVIICWCNFKTGQSRAILLRLPFFRAARMAKHYFSARKIYGMYLAVTLCNKISMRKQYADARPKALRAASNSPAGHDRRRSSERLQHQSVSPLP